MVDFKITKRTKLFEQNNDMAHNYYYLIQGHIYNENKTRYRKFKFVLWFDIFDLQEFFEKDIISQNDIKQYLNEIEFTHLLNIENYDDTQGLKQFYDYCNDTIKDYNRIISYN